MPEEKKENQGNKESEKNRVEKLAEIAKKQPSIVREFKEFISRGSVIDMAVGIIVGSAFTAIVTSLVDDMLMPIIGMIIAGVNFKSLSFEIPWGSHPVIAFGSFIQAVINFLLIALCVFLLVKALNRLSFKKKDEKKEPPKPSKEEILLTEIRDLLKANGGNVTNVKEENKK